jgi:hypothetical protein
MILLRRRYRPHLPLDLAEVLLPVAGDRLEPARRLSPMLVKIWCAERRTPGLVGKWTDDLTLVSDLAGFPELLARLGSTTRRHIRRALDQDGMTRVDDWSVEQVIGFQREHDASNPNLPDPVELNRLYDADRLTVTAADVAGETLAVHVNIEDFPRVRVLKGYTKRRRADTSERYSLVGRANKALHYLDMAAYHERGFTLYDWGGFTGEAGNGIDHFKLQFLGEVRPQAHFRGLMPPGAPPVAF